MEYIVEIVIGVMFLVGFAVAYFCEKENVDIYNPPNLDHVVRKYIKVDE
jgi:hypothetical protein